MSAFYFYKGDKGGIDKLCAVIGRVEGANFSPWDWSLKNPPSMYGGMIFILSDKLDRRMKLMKLSDKYGGKKKYQKLLFFISKSKKFQSLAEIDKYLSTLIPVKKVKRYADNYNVMPKDPHKDNQKIYTLDKKESKWDEIEDKKKLIKAGSRVGGINTRRPRKTASKRKWKNFLKKFSREK